MKVIYILLLLLFLVAPLGFAQPKKVAAEIQTIKTAGKYLFTDADGATDAAAEQAASRKLLQLIRLQYGVPENAGTQRSADDLETFRPVAGQSKDLLYERITWSDKKKFFAFVYIEKKAAQNLAKRLATQAFRDEEEFVFGEFTHADPVTSSSEAKADLITRIQQRVETDVTVSSEETRTQAGNNRAQYSEKRDLKSQSKVMSRMTLVGLKTISLNLDGQTYTFAYITKPDIEKSFESVKTKILQMVTDGEQYLEEGNIGLALSTLYRAYIYCDAHYSTLPYTFKNGQRVQDVRAALENRLIQLMDSVKLEARPAYDIDERQVVVPMNASFRGKPFQGLVYVLEYGAYISAGQLAAAGNLIELANFTPEGRITILRPKLFIDIQDHLKNDQILADLEPTRQLSVTKELPVDFSNLYKVEINGEFNGNTVKFTIKPRFDNLIRLIRWEYGDGASDTRANTYTSHTYDEPGTYKLVIQLNGDPNLREERYVDFAGKRLRMTPPPACRNCEKVETPVEVVLRVKPAYEELSGIRTTAGLMQTIKTLSDRGKIVFGKQSSIGDSEGALVMVVDEKNVVDQLIFSGNRYFQMTTREPVTDLAQRYQGKRLITSFFQEFSC